MEEAIAIALPVALPWRERLRDVFDDIKKSSKQGIILLRVQFGLTQNDSHLYTQMWSYVPPSAFAVLHDVVHPPAVHTHYYAVNPSSVDDNVSAFFVVPQRIALAVAQAFLLFMNLTDVDHSDNVVRTLLFSDDRSPDSPTLVVMPSVLVSLAELQKFVTEFNDCNAEMTIVDAHLTYAPYAAIRLPGSCRPTLKTHWSQSSPLTLCGVFSVNKSNFDVSTSFDAVLNDDDILSVCRVVRPSRRRIAFSVLRRHVAQIFARYPPLFDFLSPAKLPAVDSSCTSAKADDIEDFVRSQHFMNTGAWSSDDDEVQTYA